MNIKTLINIGIINTIRMNFHYFSWGGGVIHPYILVSKRFKIINLGGTVQIVNPKIGCIRIGFPGVGIADYKYERALWENLGTISFCGSANIGQGSRITNSGFLSFGDKFSISANSSIACYKKITFGNDVMISWNSLIMDTDFHSIIDANTNEILNHPTPITVGDHVWICCRTTILKGTAIRENSVVAAGSVISGKVAESNIVVGSNKRIIKDNVNWKH